MVRTCASGLATRRGSTCGLSRLPSFVDATMTAAMTSGTPGSRGGRPASRGTRAHASTGRPRRGPSGRARRPAGPPSARPSGQWPSRSRRGDRRRWRSAGPTRSRTGSRPAPPSPAAPPDGAPARSCGHTQSGTWKTGSRRGRLPSLPITRLRRGPGGGLVAEEAIGETVLDVWSFMRTVLGLLTGALEEIAITALGGVRGSNYGTCHSYSRGPRCGENSNARGNRVCTLRYFGRRLPKVAELCCGGPASQVDYLTFGASGCGELPGRRKIPAS